MLNSEQIIEKELLKLEYSKGKPAQIGYDLSVKEIKSLRGTGYVSVEKTILPEYMTQYTTKDKTYNPDNFEPIYHYRWYLTPGYYEVTFWEGCKIPNNLVGLIRQRSSMLRNGTLLHSSVFDPGFETDFMGSFIAVFHPIFIEKDARIAQIYFHECEPVSELYDGQWQNDKQRK
jgi:deoxycytidine triphosphate deaminase